MGHSRQCKRLRKVLGDGPNADTLYKIMKGHLKDGMLGSRPVKDLIGGDTEYERNEKAKEMWAEAFKGEWK